MRDRDPRPLIVVAALIAAGVACLLAAGTPAPPATDAPARAPVIEVTPIPHEPTPREAVTDA